MKAVTYSNYTNPSGLTVQDIDRPDPGSDQVLVRVGASGLNPFDWHAYQGNPKIMRTKMGLRVKEPRTVGADFAGTVEAVGENVTTVSVGDRVIAEAGFGGCAEFALANADAVARVANNVAFNDAAASIMGSLTALQALRDSGKLRKGESVLVWGASGGVGHLAVQVARALGASQVDAVCSGRNVAMVRELGADRVFDYTAEDVAGQTYDVIIDMVSTASTRELKALLTPNGRVVTVGALGGGSLFGPLGPLVRRALAAKARQVDSRSLFAATNADDLSIIAGWLADGSLRPVIAQTYPLDQTADACVELERGRVAGKLVIQVNP